MSVETVRFACTACGKCCTEPPEMTVLEAIALGDVFVPAIVYRLTSLPRDDNEAAFASLTPHAHFRDMDRRAFVACLRESAAVKSAGATLTEPGWEHHLSVTARPWTYEPTPCPALVGRSCGIHARRPLTCRTVPIRYDVPAGLLVRAYRAVVDAGRASVDPFECDVSEAAPLLLEDEDVRSEEYRAARAQGLEAAVAERALAARVLTRPGMPTIQQVFDLLRRGQLVSVSFPGALVAAHEVGLVDQDKVRAFAAAQTTLLAGLITAALRRQRKSDRDMTDRFRALASAYESLSFGPPGPSGQPSPLP